MREIVDLDSASAHYPFLPDKEISQTDVLVHLPRKGIHYIITSEEGETRRFSHLPNWGLLHGVSMINTSV